MTPNSEKTENKKEAHLPDALKAELPLLCRRHGVRRLILFGSRARGDERPKSDIDLAAEGCANFSEFAYDVDNHTPTLLLFDIIDLDRPVSPELLREIQKDGIVIYPDPSTSQSVRYM